jgi:hypothetical protein
MAKLKLIPVLLGLLAIAPVAGAAPQYDFVICANVNKGYVIGSKIVTTNGLFRLNDAGEWRHFGYNDSTITGAAFDPRDPSVYYTSALNGLWAPLEGSATGRMANSWDMTEGRDVAIDPNSPDDVYFAITDGVGFTNDRGMTVQRRDHGLPARGKFTEAIEIDRTTAGRVFAACASGVYLTDDAGRNWRQVLSAQAQVNDIQQSPHDPKEWIAVTDEDGAWISRDRGLTWTQLKGVPFAHGHYNVAFDPTDARRIVIGGWTYGVLVSEDNGKTWTPRNAGLPENPRAWRVGINPNNGRLYASLYMENLYYSDDFGRTWQADVLEGSLVSRFIAVPVANR